MDFNACVVLLPDGSYVRATVRGALMGRSKALGNAVVVGDDVGLEWEQSGDQARAVIAEVATRRSAFSRRASGRDVVEQVVAVNLDQVVVVAAVAQPEFKAGLVDRLLAQCDYAGLPAMLVMNKQDLADAREIAAILDAYQRAGVTGVAVSAKTGIGVDGLRERLRGQRSLFVGHSGVGKSSLLNALEPSFELLSGIVNEKTGKGRHTTTAATLLRPEPDVEMIDTPGVRGFGLWGIEPESLAEAYAEFRPLLGHCRFADCAHLAEPGCALRAAVEAGTVSRRRYDSFLKLRDELVQERGSERLRGKGWM